MRDDHERGAAGEQVLGEPADALDVEVVGGLVEDQEVEVLHERRAQGDPLALAAREPVDRGVEAPVAAGTEALDDRAAAGVRGPLVVGDRPAEHGVADGRPGQLRLLADQRHLQPADGAATAAVGRQRPGQHLDQRGLPAAVAADDADAVAGVDAEGHAVEDGLRTPEADRHRLEVDEVGHGFQSPGARTGSSCA